MLREHIQDIMVRWNPKQRAGSAYDPVAFLESPEQARKLIRHLEDQLAGARRDKNKELAAEIAGILERVEALAKPFFRWERNMAQAVMAQEMSEIKKMPLGF